MKRVLGIDPGATVGLCVLDFEHGRARYVWHGSTTCQDVAGIVALVGAIPPLVCIERVEHVHGITRRGKGVTYSGIGAAYAEGLARAAWLGGELAGAIRALGSEVVTVEAGTWRKALAGGAHATDADVAAMVRLRVVGWPKVSNAHARDAAGCALWAGLARAAVRVEVTP